MFTFYTNQHIHFIMINIIKLKYILQNKKQQKSQKNIYIYNKNQKITNFLSKKSIETFFVKKNCMFF